MIIDSPLEYDEHRELNDFMTSSSKGNHYTHYSHHKPNTGKYNL